LVLVPAMPTVEEKPKAVMPDMAVALAMLGNMPGASKTEETSSSVQAANEILTQVENSTKLQGGVGGLTSSKKKLVLPPSILLGGEISVPGDVRYFNLGEEDSFEELTAGEAKIRKSSRVKTTQRVVQDTEGYEAAHALASELRNEIRRVSRATVFGPLCPAADEGKLDAVLTEVRRRAAEFNATARYHFVRVGHVKATIGSEDERAARELVFDVQRIMSELREALDRANVKRIREIVARAKALEPIFPDKERGVLEAAFRAAREAATEIRKQSEETTKKIDEIKASLDLSPVEVARSLFLEYEVPEELNGVREALEQGRSMLDKRAAALEFDEPLLKPSKEGQG
jgi:hypothetical protein